MFRQLLPVYIVASLIWLALVWHYDLLEGIKDNLFISLTMFVGAFIAGGTAEGGGAVAFPVMTLLYDFTPPVSAQFALAIQSFGMTAASYIIYRRGIRVANNVIVYVLPVACLGFICGKLFFAAAIPAKLAKLFFVSFWLSFGIVLYLKNRMKSDVKNTVALDSIEARGALIAAGFFGGCLSSVFGSGVDIVCFSLITLRFGLSEKIATPTSVILMAGVSVFGTLVNVSTTGLDREVIALLVAAIPVVVLMAPLGTYFVNSQSRIFISRFLYVILIVQYFGALIILEVGTNLFVFSALVVMLGVVFFHKLRLFNGATPRVRPLKDGAV